MGRWPHLASACSGPALHSEGNLSVQQPTKSQPGLEELKRTLVGHDGADARASATDQDAKQQVARGLNSDTWPLP